MRHCAESPDYRHAPSRDNQRVSSAVSFRSAVKNTRAGRWHGVMSFATRSKNVRRLVTTVKRMLPDRDKWKLQESNQWTFMACSRDRKQKDRREALMFRSWRWRRREDGVRSCPRAGCGKSGLSNVECADDHHGQGAIRSIFGRSPRASWVVKMAWPRGSSSASEYGSLLFVCALHSAAEEAPAVRVTSRRFAKLFGPFEMLTILVGGRGGDDEWYPCCSGGGGGVGGVTFVILGPNDQLLVAGGGGYFPGNTGTSARPPAPSWRQRWRGRRLGPEATKRLFQG